MTDTILNFFTVPLVIAVIIGIIRNITWETKKHEYI